MFLHKMGWLFQKVIYPDLTWSRYGKEKIIYLTFDDGPIPELTEWVLDELNRFGAKATFFCVGDNVKKYPQIFNRILEEKHSVGNHTFNHLNGWKNDDLDYLQNIEMCDEIIEKTSNKPTNLFRPPYGRIKKSQIEKVLPNKEIVMWDVLSGDFSQSITPQKCLAESINHTQNGSIIVFHDNLKAEKNLKQVLPKYLKHFSDLGFSFEKL